MEKAFNKLPDIDTSRSDEFKAKAQHVISENIPNWVDFLTLEYNQELEEGKGDDEDTDPINIMAQGHVTNNDLHYMNSLYRRVQLPQLLVKHILTTLFEKIIIYTNQDLIDQIKKASEFLNKHLKTGYIGVLEYDLISFKSKDWVLHQALNYLDIKPSCITYYKKINKTGIYVIMDDGVYSGTQITFDIMTIISNVNFPVNIYVTIMFMAQIGIDYMEYNLNFDSKEETDEYTIYKKDGNHIYLWKKYILIPSIPSVLTSIFDAQRVKYNKSIIKDIHTHLLQNAGSIVIFEHKVPDYKSLPWIVANVFFINMAKHYVNNPPYSPSSRKKLDKTVTDYTFECFRKNVSFGKRKKLKAQAFNLIKLNKDIKYLNLLIT